MSASGASILVLLAAVVLMAPRRWALLGIMAGVLYLTQRQSIVVLGLNMYPMRFLELVGFVRVVRRGEFVLSRMNGMDRALIWAYVYVTTVYLIRTSFGYGTSADIAMTSNFSKLGQMVDVLLCYFAFRGLMANGDDLRWLLRRFVLLLVPYVLLLLIERQTGSNPLHLVGAIPTVWIDDNGGRVRCLGSFMHPSLLGTLGASFMLLYVGLAFDKIYRISAIAGLGLCLAIVLLANSGSPLTFVMVGVTAWLLWPIRTRMFVVRGAIVVGLLLLALVMKDPLWYLPTKMSLLFGGSGWHRSYLMEQGANHIDKWWLAGMPLDLTQDWFPYLVLGAADMTNLYLGFGVDAGVVAIILLVLLLTRTFGWLGKALATVRRSSPPFREHELLLWGLGAVLMGHIVNFLAITYFDQTNVVWLMQLAAISSLSQALATTRGRVEPVTSGLGAKASPVKVAK